MFTELISSSVNDRIVSSQTFVAKPRSIKESQIPSEIVVGRFDKKNNSRRTVKRPSITKKF